MDESEQKCLVTEVKNVWSRNGCYCVWSRHGAGHEKRFVSELKQRLSCNFIQKWNATIRDNDGCFPHRSVKSVSEPEQHLTVLVELDCANYDLVCLQLTTIFIATVSVLETEIVCFVVNALEDEEHLLFTCPLHAEIRMKLLDDTSQNTILQPLCYMFSLGKTKQTCFL